MREHFSSVSRWKVLGGCLYRPASYYLADLYLLLALAVLFALASFEGGWPLLIVSAAAFIGFRFRVDAVLRTIFPAHCTAHPEALRRYRADFRLLRFVLFREKLLASGVSPEIAAACLPLAQKEHELTECLSIASRPHITWLVMLLIGLIAGTSGILDAWLKGVIPLLIYLIAIILAYAVLFADMFRPRRFTEKEFELFLYWFSHDAVPQPDGAGGAARQSVAQRP